MRTSINTLLLMAVVNATTAIAQEATDPVGYLRPEGAFYQGLSESWSQYPVTKIVVRPWTPFTYQNRCSQPLSATWTMGGEAVSADLDGNLEALVEPIPAGYVESVLPTLTLGEQSYTLGQSHRNWAAYKASVAWADSIVALSVADPGRIIGTGSNGNVLTNFRPLPLTSGYKYNYGTMAVTVNGGTYYNRGLRQFFERPMGPLWIDRVSVPAISYAATPLSGDATLTLTFYETVDDNGVLRVGNKLAELTCRASDVISQGSQSVSTGTLQLSTLVFRHSDSQPLLLDRPFAIEIEGFQQEGVEVGLAAQIVDDMDAARCGGSSLLMQDANHNNIGGTLTYRRYVPCLSLIGMYDNVVNLTSEDADSLEVAVTGGEALHKDGTPAQVKTAIRWRYGDADANYQVEGLPEWLTLKVDESRRELDDNQYGHGLVVLSLTAEPLPAGIAMRRAEIYITGKGVRTEKPIVVTQGQEELSGIALTSSRPSSPTPRYSPQGYCVGNHHRGIVIEQGCKHVQK